MKNIRGRLMDSSKNDDNDDADMYWSDEDDCWKFKKAHSSGIFFNGNKIVV